LTKSTKKYAYKSDNEMWMNDIDVKVLFK